MRVFLLGCVALPIVAALVLAAGFLGARALLDARNAAKLEEMGDNRARFEALFERIEARSGCWVLITSGSRSEEEQAALKRRNKKNAAPGRSLHEKQRAMDVNLVCPTQGMLMKADRKATWEATGAPDVARTMGFRWGGDFKSYHDPVHFEL